MVQQAVDLLGVLDVWGYVLLPSPVNKKDGTYEHKARGHDVSGDSESPHVVPYVPEISHGLPVDDEGDNDAGNSGKSNDCRED